jgi:hypothetical protein
MLDVESLAPEGDPGMDCGVAVVCSCVCSCGTDGQHEGDGYVEECVYVQRDLLMQ